MRNGIATALYLMTMAAGYAAAQGHVITSFENLAGQQLLKPHNANISVVSEHATAGTHALRIEFETADWPNVTFAPDRPWNWSKEGALAFDVTNPGTYAVSFHIRVDDDVAADGVKHCRTGSGTIEPGKTATFVLPLAGSQDAMSLGMRGLPRVPGVNDLGAEGSGPFDLRHIVAFQIFLNHPAAPATLFLDNVRVQPSSAISLEGIVDRYGQYTRADWPGKIHTDADLKRTHATESALLETHPALSDRDLLGGWSAGPKQQASGFFRTQNVNGKWWLVTPEGHLFFSNGMDCVNTDGATVVTGREKMFTWLPKKGEPLAGNWGHFGPIHSGPVKDGDDFNFLTANLTRKYGPDGVNAFYDLSLRRLSAWGFNTIANWSDERLYHNGKIPYTATGGIGGDHARISSGSDYWSKMHDPFDPQFVADVPTSLQGLVNKVKGDKLCIGYFVDNELSWGGFGDDDGRYGLALGALSAPAKQPAKSAFVAKLREKYATIAQLNMAWGTAFGSWDDLEGPVKLPVILSVAAKRDMGDFVRSFALKYFTVIRDYLKHADPDHLYLGCRFAWRTPEAVEAAAQVCDVVSFNVYAPQLDKIQWAFTSGLQKPCIIGEFHFGALDRGMFHPGLVSTPDQNTRAATYREYVRSVADNPAFVGCLWFQYVDEPLTGRTWDGENYNIGFVNVTDTPYPEMVSAARQAHGELYSRRFH